MTGAGNAPLALSIVVCGRNDDYGETFALRMQTFLRYLAALDERHKRLFELIVVEWNPPQDRVPLAEAFDWSGLANARVITVPAAAHAAIANPSRMPLLEFWAKNVGVRRAKAPFVLSTNPDILLSPAFFDFVACGALDPQAFYRADRYDFEPEAAFSAPGASILDAALKAVFEVHTRNTIDPEEPFSHLIDPAAPIENWPQSQAIYRETLSEDGAIILCERRRDPLSGLHTQASGDFILAAKSAWESVRGHWERTDTFTHVDSYLVCQLHAAGLRQRILRRPTLVLHMDHSRDEQKSRPVRPYAEVAAELSEVAAGAKANPNHDQWGLGDLELIETRAPKLTSGPRAAIAPGRLAKATRDVNARLAAQSIYKLEQEIIALRVQLDEAQTRAAADATRAEAQERIETSLREALAAAEASCAAQQSAATAADAERAAEATRHAAEIAALERRLSLLSDEQASLRANFAQSTSDLKEARAGAERMGIRYAQLRAEADDALRDAAAREGELRAAQTAWTEERAAMVAHFQNAALLLEEMHAQEVVALRTHLKKYAEDLSRTVAETQMLAQALEQQRQSAEDGRAALQAALAKSVEAQQDALRAAERNDARASDARDAALALEKEAITREARIETLEAALLDMERDHIAGAAERDAIFAEYKNIVENSRYLRIRRRLLELLRGG